MDICSQSGCTRTRDRVLACDLFLRDHFRYRREEKEVLRTVPFMLNDLDTIGEMQGDCDDMAIMGCSLFLSLDIPARFTAIKSESDLEFDHVFSEARIGTTWVPVDPTVHYGTRYHHYGIMSQVA
jgi:transglutaminase-like putative cysteine protease